MQKKIGDQKIKNKIKKSKTLQEIEKSRGTLKQKIK